MQPKIFSSPEMDYRELQTILHIIGYLLLKVRDYPFTKLGITSPSVAWKGLTAMESMVFDAVLLCLAAIGLIVSFIKNREMDSVPVQAEDSKEKDKREE